MYGYADSYIDALSNHPKWRSLLHIKENNISEITDINFFLSKQTNPKTELETLLKEKSCENICKYPARYKFLSDALDLNISFEHCVDLQKFLKDSRGETASIVFASSFLGSPSSYFGHTFIKINKKDNPFFSQTISFAAEVPQDTNFFRLISKGMSGGFEGRYTVAPYFKLTEGYNIIEQRTLYEYKLNLTKEQIEDMLWHTYEMLSIRIPYKFFTENCSYEIFWLFEAIKYNDNIINELSTFVLPYETIHVLKTRNMVVDYQVRKPLIEELYQTYNDLTDDEKRFFSELKDSTTKQQDIKSAKLSKQEQNRAIFLLNGYYDILFKRFKISKADFNEVKAMSYEKINSSSSQDFEPKKSSRVSFGSIKKHNQVGQVLNFRPVLFDRFEERDNFLSESTLEFLNVGISNFDNKARIENIDIIKMESFNKRFDFYEPLSWRVYMGLDRSFETDSLEPIIELGRGITKGNEILSFYGLVQAGIYPSQAAINLQGLMGLSLWLEQVHINFDYKQNILNYGGKSKDKQQVSLFYPFTKEIGVQLIYEAKMNNKNILFSYKF